MIQEDKQMDNGNNTPPHIRAGGGLLEIVDRMCAVTELMADIIRKQTIQIEQEHIADEFAGLRKRADDDLDIIEYQLRRYRT